MQDNRKKRKKTKVILIIIIFLVIGIMIFLNRKKYTQLNYDENTLIGTFLYEENNTKYVFKEDGTGSMNSGDYKFDYNYKIDGNILTIDFLKSEVHDVVYYFELNKKTLKLISKEGTDTISEQYILKRKNK